MQYTILVAAIYEPVCENEGLLRLVEKLLDILGVYLYGYIRHSIRCVRYRSSQCIQRTAGLPKSPFIHDVTLTLLVF
jgi:hypothetical protein